MRRPAWRIGVVAALSILLFGSGCVSIQLIGGRQQRLVETRLAGEGGPKILLLDIEGVLDEAPRDGSFLRSDRESSVARIREQLDRAREDPKVRALLLRINSPGGTVTASDLIYTEILRYKREEGVPVVAQLMGIATSGGYYVAMAADLVIAHPTTVTGSIGVLFLGVNVVGLMEKLGIEDQTLVAGPHKDAASPLRRMSPDERAQIQAVLDDMHARFVAVIDQGRAQLVRERVVELADGRIFSAPRAREVGLVDRIGDLEDSRAAAEGLVGLGSAQVISYHRPREWKQNVYNRPLVPPRIEVEIGSLLRLPRPGFLYLWAPGSF